MTLKDKTVLVTGASRGFGRAIAEEMLRLGAHVLALGRDPVAMDETRASLATIGGEFEMVTMDVCDESAVTNYITALPCLDVVVNNAGIAHVQSLIETPAQEIRDILEVNVIGAFVVMRESARKMLQTNGGQIINIASDAAIRGIARMGPYVASKHALLGLSRSMSLELRQQGVRVTTFCPGPISTDILGSGTGDSNAMSPEDLAKTITHLVEVPPEIEIQELLVQPTPQRQ
ncbi:MAG: SDR family oxidoreductase [Candidatus Poribacteria bacterium]|jgi:short-subunit dehydrogenase|nr:SDR family oxidoreductase [Candidatus Poribacteria bacterium]